MRNCWASCNGNLQDHAYNGRAVHSMAGQSCCQASAWKPLRHLPHEHRVGVGAALLWCCLQTADCDFRTRSAAHADVHSTALLLAFRTASTFQLIWGTGNPAQGLLCCSCQSDAGCRAGRRCWGVCAGKLTWTLCVCGVLFLVVLAHAIDCAHAHAHVQAIIRMSV